MLPVSRIMDGHDLVSLFHLAFNSRYLRRVGLFGFSIFESPVSRGFGQRVFSAAPVFKFLHEDMDAPSQAAS
jgi:hypothetical protein